MFLEDGENIVSEIPTSWLCDDDCSCWWPNNNKKVAKLMVLGSTPDDTWTKYKINILGFASTLSRARLMAERDIGTSADEEELGRGKRKTTRKPSTDSESSSQSDYENLPHPKQNNPLELKELNISIPKVTDNEASDKIQILNMEFANVNKAVNNIDITRDIIIEDLSIQNIQAKNTEDEISKTVTLDQILKITKSNNILLKTMESRLERLEFSVNNREIETPSCESENYFKNLPVKSFEELKRLEDYLLENNQENVKTMMSFLSVIGGKNFKEATHRYLSTCYSPELTVHCSWLGQRNNFRMRDLKSIKLIQDTLLKQFNVKVHEFEQTASEWIRLSKQRLQREKKKEA